MPISRNAVPSQAPRRSCGPPRTAAAPAASAAGRNGCGSTAGSRLSFSFSVDASPANSAAFSRRATLSERRQRTGSSSSGCEGPRRMSSRPRRSSSRARAVTRRSSRPCEPREARRPARRAPRTGTCCGPRAGPRIKVHAGAGEARLRRPCRCREDRRPAWSARNVSRLRPADDREAAGLVEVGRDLGEKLVVARARPRRVIPSSPPPGGRNGPASWQGWPGAGAPCR